MPRALDPPTAMSTREPAPAPSSRRAPTTHPLLGRHADLVRRIAGGFERRLPPNVLCDDLVAAGMRGLWDAIRKHGDLPASNFEWYARVRIRGAIVDELRAQDWLPRRARARAALRDDASGSAAVGAPVVVRLEDISDSEQARCFMATTPQEVERMLEARMARERLERAVEQLPAREQYIVSLHYFSGVKFRELGRRLGVSEPRISQLHSRAMGRLRVILTEAA